MSLNVFLALMLPYLGRRFIAYILFSHILPHIWQHPARIQFARWLSAAVDGYCDMLAVLAESTAMLLGFKGPGIQTVPGAYPMDDMSTCATNEHRLVYSPDVSDPSEHNRIGGDKGASDEMKFVDHNSEKSNHFKTIISRIISPGLDLDAPYLSPAQFAGPSVEESMCSKNTGSDPSENLKYKQLAVSPNTIDKVGHCTKPSTTPALIPKANASNKHDRVRKYAGMRTLKLPGRPMRPMKASTEAILAIRRIDEELAIEESKRETHCARELAGDGIFSHFPTTNYHPEAVLYPRTARRIWRETSVGPLNPSWSDRHARDIPTIKITKPEGPQTPRNFGRHGADYDQVASTSAETAGKPGRVRSNAVYIPTRPVLLTAPTSSTNVNSSPPKFTPSNSNEVSNHHLPVVTKHEALADRAKRLSKNRTSMSDWLAAISAGSNSLVADHVATKAGSVLRASVTASPSSTPPLSPTGSASSSDSSTPSTPIDDFFLPLSMVEETKPACISNDHRRRARCSYSGNEYGVVVAPVIPEELLTEEIGVAC